MSLSSVWSAELPAKAPTSSSSAPRFLLEQEARLLDDAAKRLRTDRAKCTQAKLLTAAATLLREGTPESIEKARKLQLRFAELQERAGASYFEIGESLAGRERLSLLMYYAEVEPSKVTRFASYWLRSLAILLEDRVPVPRKGAAGAKDILSTTFVEFATWLSSHPEESAEFIYQKLIFDRLAQEAIEATAKGYAEVAQSMATDLATMVAFFKTPRALQSGLKHSWPREVVKSAVARIGDVGEAEKDEIEHQATMEALNTAAIALAFGGSAVATGGASLAMAGTVLTVIGGVTGGALAFADAYDRAASGDEARFYSLQTAMDVVFVAGALGVPLAKGLKALKVGEAGNLERSVSERLASEVARGGAGAKLASTILGLEKATRQVFRAGAAATTIQAIVYRTYRMLNAKKIAEREGKEPWMVVSESAGFLALKFAGGYTVYRGWKAEREQAKEADVNAILEDPAVQKVLVQD